MNLTRRSLFALAGKVAFAAALVPSTAHAAPSAAPTAVVAPEAPTRAPAAISGVVAGQMDRGWATMAQVKGGPRRPDVLYPTMSYRESQIPSEANPLGERAHFVLNVQFPEGDFYSGYTGYVDAPTDYRSLPKVEADGFWESGKRALLQQAYKSPPMAGYELVL